MKRFLSPAAAILALLLPGAVFANVTGNNITLGTGQTVNFETGAVGSSGGDILYNGSAITFQGAAKGANLTTLSGGSFSGSSSFNTIVSAGASTVSSFPQSTTPISSPTTGTIIVYTTNSANIGVLLITSTGGGALGLQFVTFESGTGGGGGPTITAVLSNYGLIPAGFNNSGIAPGTLFIIKGTGLSTTDQFVLQDPAPGLPTTLNNASVTISTTGTAPGFYYAGSTQLALVLPSDTPTGAATVTVKVNGQTSNSFPITVVANNFGMLSADQTGSGSVKAVNPLGSAAAGTVYISYTNSAAPGQIVSIYGTGLGADPARDLKFVQPTGAQINGLASFYVGGMAVPIQYQGPSGYPGLDQVNIMLPPNVPTGCFVSIVGVNPQGIPTNFLTMPIGNGTCQDPSLGYTSSVVSGLTGQSIRAGLLEMLYMQTDTQAPVTLAEGIFDQFTITSLGSSSNAVSIGGCVVFEQVAGVKSTPPTALNPGTITVSSPNPGFQPVPLTSFGAFAPGLYATFNANGTSSLPAGFLTQAGGTFTFNATAGTTAPAVGAFTAQVAFPTPLLSWTNEASVSPVVRSNGLTVTWSGGGAGTYVVISGFSSSGNASGSFTCLAPIAPGSFMVPSYVLGALPAAKGGLLVENATTPASYVATGLDLAYATGVVEYLNDSVTYQ